MVTQVEDKEKELFNTILKNAAKLAVEHKLAGLGIELHAGELESIYRKYAEITDVALFERFSKYLKSPEGRHFFKITIRTELWRAGFRPRGWEE